MFMVSGLLGSGDMWVQGCARLQGLGCQGAEPTKGHGPLAPRPGRWERSNPPQETARNEEGSPSARGFSE